MSSDAARSDSSSVPGPRPGPAVSRHRWRVVDIVVASVVAVATGVLFWVWSSSWSALSAPLAVFPPVAGLLTGVWCLAGPLGGLIVRKPGAALYCELLAATVSALIGTQWGPQVLVSGLVQGLGAELVFLLFLYRRWGVGVAVLSGLGAGLFLGLSENIMYNVEWAFGWQAVYAVLASVSGALLAGLGAWLLVRALAASGALSAFAAGRGTKEV